MKNKRTAEREAARQAAAEAIVSQIPGAFQGAAHSYLRSLYCDPTQPVELRLDAVKAVVRYEKPVLASATLDATFRGAPDTLSDAQLAAIAGIGGAGASASAGDPSEPGDLVH